MHTGIKMVSRYIPICMWRLMQPHMLIPVHAYGDLERYSHKDYLIKVDVMALAGEVARELSPIRSWSNKDYDLKLAEKARG